MRKIHVERGKLIFGLCVIAVGVVLLLKALGVNVELFFAGWWSLFLIVPGTIGLFRDKDKFGAAAEVAIGVCLLLAAQGIISWGAVWKLMLGVVLICIGLSAIFKKDN